MKAQIYTQSDKNKDYTSLIVTKGSTVYFKDVLNTPELTAVQRGVSFVKHQLDVDTTEIYSNLTQEEIEKDVYINWCKVNAQAGKEPDEKMQKLCETELQSELIIMSRMKGGRNE